MKSSVWIPLTVALAAVPALFLAQQCRAGYESPRYMVELREGRFEVRNYPAMTVARVPMQEGGMGGMNGSFGRLFRFIQGGNAASQKIPMTAPVLIERNPAPKQETMDFILPEAVVRKGVPTPRDPEMKIVPLAAGRYASLRFGGGRTAENERKALERLRAELNRRGLRPEGSPVFAYYDPPMIPTFLRRNEVLLRLGAKP